MTKYKDLRGELEKKEEELMTIHKEYKTEYENLNSL